jgi:hypothetical protein
MGDNFTVRTTFKELETNNKVEKTMLQKMMYLNLNK